MHRHSSQTLKILSGGLNKMSLGGILGIIWGYWGGGVTILNFSEYNIPSP